jgi:tripartite-type tricarboxylate transporter receptor subunit TctC
MMKSAGSIHVQHPRKSEVSTRRRIVLAPLTALGVAALMPISSRAQAYPAKPLRLVVPFPAGGPTDIVARPLAQMLGDALKQAVVVDNRGGAGGLIGADSVAKAAADGYTLLMGTVGTHAINAALYKTIPYHPTEDFTPLSSAASAPVAVVAGPAGKFASLQDLIAQAKAKPGSIAYGSAGNGTPGHLTGAMFASAAGIQLTHVPYKGSAPAVTDLLGGQIPLMFDPLQSVQPHIASGKLRALAVTSRARARVLPDVPTVAESGLPDFEFTAWWAVFAPARLPADVARRLIDEIGAVVRSPEFESKLGNLGVTPLAHAGAALGSFQKSELGKWTKAVRDAGVALE